MGVIFSNLPAAGDPLLIRLDYEKYHRIHMWGRPLILFSSVQCNAFILGAFLIFFYTREEDHSTQAHTLRMTKYPISFRTLKFVSGVFILRAIKISIRGRPNASPTLEKYRFHVTQTSNIPIKFYVMCGL